MLRKTMIVLATAAALTGGLTADAFARTAVEVAVDTVAVAGVDTPVVSVAALIWVAALAGAISAVLAGLSAAALRVSGLPGRTTASTTTEVSVAACVSGPAFMTTGAATATPITTPTAAIRPSTDVRPHKW